MKIFCRQYFQTTVSKNQALCKLYVLLYIYCYRHMNSDLITKAQIAMHLNLYLA